MLTRIGVFLLIPLFIFFAMEKGGNTMVRANSQVEMNTDTPSIDLRIPDKTETATFALG